MLLILNNILFFTLFNCYTSQRYRLKYGIQNQPYYNLNQNSNIDYSTIDYSNVQYNNINHNNQYTQAVATTSTIPTAIINTSTLTTTTQVKNTSYNNYNGYNNYNSNNNYQSPQYHSNYNPIQTPSSSSSTYSIIPTAEPSNNNNNNTYNNDNYNTGNSKTCKLPNDSLITPITKDQLNAGWAMSPDQQCTYGKWCPYACKSGYYSSQWDPTSKCPNGPECGSMNGGLYCDNNGNLQLPFKDKPLCSLSLNNVNIKSELNEAVSFCQTVYPGNEAMIIPTVAEPQCSNQIINSPPSTYWQGTSAQYYVNPKNSDSSKCIWGDANKPYGNWAPYVLGIGQGAQSLTYMSLTVNPNFGISLHKSSSNLLYKIEIKCNNCQSVTNKPCILDLNNNINTACTISVPPGNTASIILS